jgi:hypothetical protein
MIAIAQRTIEHPKGAHWHEKFLEMLPGICRYACHAFRFSARAVREERVADVIAVAFVAYRRLVDQGREDLAYPTVLARYGAARVRQGRCVGATASCRDVLSTHAQRQHGFQVERLGEHQPSNGGWRQIAVEDRRSSPAEIAALRIDFAAWLASLSRRERQIATKLAIGETTAAVAKLFRLSAARISQLRRELHETWLRFHGEECLDREFATAG